MSTYPGALDDLGSTNPTPTTPTNDGDGHAAQHSAANDAIDAIQATLGVDPQGGSTDVATRLDDLAFADLADVDMSSISDGDVPVWNAGTSKFEPGAGGGGGLADASRLWTPASGVNATYSDEFDDASLDGAWTRVDASGGTGRATWTEAGDCLSLLLAGSDSASETHSLVRPCSLGVGDYIETHVSFAGKKGGTYPFGGLIVADGNTHGAGTQVICAVWTADPNLSRSKWAGYNSRSSQNLLWNLMGASAYLRIKRSASTTYDFYHSADGVSWLLAGSETYSGTPSHVGFTAGSWLEASQTGFSFSYFRVGS